MTFSHLFFPIEPMPSPRILLPPWTPAHHFRADDFFSPQSFQARGECALKPIIPTCLFPFFSVPFSIPETGQCLFLAHSPGGLENVFPGPFRVGFYLPLGAFNPPGLDTHLSFSRPAALGSYFTDPGRLLVALILRLSAAQRSSVPFLMPLRDARFSVGSPLFNSNAAFFPL